MIDAIFQGVAMGLILAIMVGPVFIALMYVSINKGIYAGFKMSLGIITADMIYMLAAILGIIHILDQETAKYFVALGGGIVLIIAGLFTAFKKVAPPPGKEPIVKSKKSVAFMSPFVRGFLINALNPFILIFWISITGLFSMYREDSGYVQLTTFSISLIVTLFLTDLLKVYGASKIRAYLSSGILSTINKISGAGLIIFGIYLLMMTVGR
jgi:threonine/homoserine/homoserine lactone efflux protein